MADIDELLNAVEWTSLYIPIKIPKGVDAKIEFAKKMARGLVIQSENDEEFPSAPPESSPVAPLLEDLLGLQ